MALYMNNCNALVRALSRRLNRNSFLRQFLERKPFLENQYKNGKVMNSSNFAKTDINILDKYKTSFKGLFVC